MKLTKRTIEKLYVAPIEVRLINGTYNEAKVKITNNKVGYELRAEDTHKVLRDLSCCKAPKFSFVVWHTPYSGLVHYDIPEELHELAQKLLKATEIPDDEAFKIQRETWEALEKCYAEMGWL